MTIGKALATLKQMNVLSLLVIVIVSSTLLILINYFTLRITSAVRAYINGESQYSKGQKDAARDLTLYITTQDTIYWAHYRKALHVPIGDSLARTELMKNGNEEIIRKGFLVGRNKKEDLDEMIWLFRNFKTISFMKEAIGIWKQGDYRIGQLYQLGEEAHQKMNMGVATLQEKNSLIERINTNTIELTRLEGAFSESLGDAARRINTYLFYTNLLITLLIIGNASGYALVMIKRLKEKNQDLMIINQEMDMFVYSASHDLRAPISSLKGLVGITIQERDPKKVQHYLDLMMSTLNKQDQFIKEIIDFSRNKKTEIKTTSVSLTRIIDQAILQHQYMPGARELQIEKQLDLDIIQCDQLRLEIVINNIISNAIKYSDDTKDKKILAIKTYKTGMHAVIEIADNGIGIDKIYVHRIFDMFFVTQHDQKGSGLGLYITKETVSKLQGTITVKSEKGKGTSFIVALPLTIPVQNKL